MKLPKETRRYCPYCRKHTIHSIDTVKQKARSSAHPMSRWGNTRTKLRNYRAGMGNLGRFSKPAVKDRKMKTKVTRRISVSFKCKECKKMHNIKKAIRSGRIEIGEKVAK